MKLLNVNNHSENKFYDFCHVITRVFVFQLLYERLDKDNESEGHNIKGGNWFYNMGNTQTNLNQSSPSEYRFKGGWIMGYLLLWPETNNESM